VSGQFLNSVFDRMNKLLLQAIEWTTVVDDHREVQDLIQDLNLRIVKYDSDLSWHYIERSESVEAGFITEIKEIEAMIANF